MDFLISKGVCVGCSVAKSCPTLCNPLDCSIPASPVLYYLPDMSIESGMPSNYLILCCPLLLLPSIFPSISLSSESVLRIRWPKYWSFSISLSNEYSGLISLRIDWFDLFAVQYVGEKRNNKYTVLLLFLNLQSIFYIS